MCFFGEIQIWISDSKNESWILKIYTLGGVFGSNPNPDFWDSQSEHFFGKGFEKSIFDKRFSEHKCLTCWWRPTLSHCLHIIPCFSSIYFRRLFFNPYLSCFLYVCSVCLRRLIFQVLRNINSWANSYNLTIVRCILLEKRLCFEPKYVHFAYSYVSSCRFSFLSSPRESVCCFFFYFPRHEEQEDIPCHGKWSSVFGYSVFFGSEESIWSEITNSFLDSPKNMKPDWIDSSSQCWWIQ